MIGVGVVVLVGGMCLAPAWAQTVELSDNVRKGGIDSRQRPQAGSRIRRSRAVGLLRAPAERVTDVVLDYAGYQRFMPHFVASRVLSKRGSNARVYVEVSALKGLARLWMEMQIGMAATSEPTRVISARMLRGNIKHFQAEWHVTPVSSQSTLVAFELCADPDFSIPFADGLVSDYNELEARDSVVALRKYVARKPAAAAQSR
jgi:ribosome-associated toxin RatA of RatAB toxin-antitoxin module